MTPEIKEIFAYWQTTLGHPRARLVPAVFIAGMAVIIVAGFWFAVR